MAAPKKNGLDRVLHRASQDRQFRERLLADPVAPLTEVLGTVPRNLRIKFIEKPTDLDALIVLPDFCAGGELSPTDLESVAGGEGTTWEAYETEDDEPYEPSGH